MERKDSNLMTPFDQLVSNPNMQMMKLLIPYTSPETQRFLAVYVKFSELKYTIDFFQNFKREVQAQDFEQKIFSPTEIMEEIRPYLPPKTSETLDTLMNLLHMLELFETFQETSNYKNETDGGFDPMSMMKTMLTPEQQSMVDMYQSMFSQTMDTIPQSESPSEKGEDSNDGLVR